MSDKSMYRKALRSFRLTFIVVSTLFILGCESSRSRPGPDLSKAVQVFGEEKSKAEQWAFMLKNGKWAPQSKEYIDGVRLYIEAKSSFDGLIARLRP
jgi:hypothetical protein